MGFVAVMLKSTSHIIEKIECAPAASPALEILNLSVGYNGTLTVQDVSVRIEVGTRLALIGPNGAGKSTLFKLCSL